MKLTVQTGKERVIQNLSCPHCKTKISSIKQYFMHPIFFESYCPKCGAHFRKCDAVVKLEAYPAGIMWAISMSMFPNFNVSLTGFLFFIILFIFYGVFCLYIISIITVLPGLLHFPLKEIKK